MAEAMPASFGATPSVAVALAVASIGALSQSNRVTKAEMLKERDQT